jgi:hypothetical protein
MKTAIQPAELPRDPPVIAMQVIIRELWLMLVQRRDADWAQVRCLSAEYQVELDLKQTPCSCSPDRSSGSRANRSRVCRRSEGVVNPAHYENCDGLDQADRDLTILR